MTISDNEKAWNEFNKKRDLAGLEKYIEVPEGLNPYDYDTSMGLAQIFKFGYRQCRRGRPYEILNANDAAEKAFKEGYDAAK